MQRSQKLAAKRKTWITPMAQMTALLPQPNLLVIFGGDGDLSWRKLLPAVYNLNKDGVLPSHFAVVCFGLPSTEEGTGAADPDEYIRRRARDGIPRFSRQPLEEAHWERFRPQALLRPRQLRRSPRLRKARS